MAADLTDYGGGSEIEPPLVERKYIKQSPHTGKIAGFVGHERRRDMTVYTTLRSKKHFYYNGNGYAVSNSILYTLREHHGVSRILIHEGTGVDDDVYEFALRQYTQDGKDVPDRWLDVEHDPQKYVDIDEYVFKWEGHAAAMFVRPFREACEHIGWRGYDPDLREDVEQEKEVWR